MNTARPQPAPLTAGPQAADEADVDASTQPANDAEPAGRPGRGPGIVIGPLTRAVPVAAAMGVAYGLARFAPYWVLGVNRWLWWFGVFGIANTCLVVGDRMRARLATRRVSSTPTRATWPHEAGRDRRAGDR